MYYQGTNCLVNIIRLDHLLELRLRLHLSYPHDFCILKIAMEKNVTYSTYCKIILCRNPAVIQVRDMQSCKGARRLRHDQSPVKVDHFVL